MKAYALPNGIVCPGTGGEQPDHFLFADFSKPNTDKGRIKLMCLQEKCSLKDKTFYTSLSQVDLEET